MSAAIQGAIDAALAEMETLAEAAAARTLKPAENARFEVLKAQVDTDRRALEAQEARKHLPFPSTAPNATSTGPDIRNAVLAPTPGMSPAGSTTVQPRNAQDSGDYHAGPESPSFTRDFIAWRAGTATEEQRGRITRHANWAVESRALSTTDSEGGYLVAPAYLQNDFLKLRVQTAPILSHISRMPLPNGGKTDSVNIPKQSGGVQVTYTTQNSALPETDATFTTVPATVYRFGGLQKASNFVVDRSLPGVDRIILQDLTAQLWKKVGQEVVNGTGSSAFEGILQADGIGTSTATAATPGLGDIHSAFVNAVLDVSNGHYSTEGIVSIWHPQTWMFALAQLDSTDRPLLNINGNGQNTVATATTMAAEGVVGTYAGIPVVLDNSVPTNLGAGTNESRIIVGCLRDACMLVEDTPKLAVDFSAGFDTDSARMRLTYDAAFSPELYPAAISVCGGTAFAASA